MNSADTLSPDIQQVLEALPEGVVVLRDGSEPFFNSIARRRFGLRPSGDPVPRDVIELFKDSDRSIVSARLVRGAPEAGQAPIEVRVAAAEPDEGPIVSIVAHEVQLAGEGMTIWCVRDAVENRAMHAQLLHSQKMEALGRFAGGVAHDFNNLLTVILADADWLAEQLGENHALASDVRDIRRAAERSAALTRQLLAFSRQQVLQPRRIDLNEVVASVERLVRRVLGEHIDLVVVRSAELGTVHADPGQIEHVLLNLCLNARDAMPGGGRLTIRTMNEPAGRPPGQTTPASGAVVIEVADTGVGMDAGVLSRIFEPFFTTKEVGRGTGLGLATVLGIVEQSGGTVSVASTVGRGTTFRVRFPRCEMGADDLLVRGTEPTAQRPLRVLLVEDDLVLRRVARRILQSRGHRVTDCMAAEEALARFSENPEDFDLLVSDVVMPRMDGISLRDAILRIRPGLPVLLMSGFGDRAFAESNSAAPPTVFLNKPFAADELLAAVSLAVRQG